MARYVVAVALLVTASVDSFVASNSAAPHPAAMAPLPPWDAEQLPAELLVSEFLYAGSTRTFLFHKRKREGPLSFTVTPCTSSVEWSVSVRPDDPTDVRSMYNSRSESSTSTGGTSGHVTQETLLAQFRGKELRSFRLPSNNGSGMESALPGAYLLRVRALERDSFVQLFASLRLATGAQMQVTGSGERGGDTTAPPTLPRTRLWLRRRRRRPGHRLTVRWEPSKVDPHLMRYCLVVNPYRHYSTLCEARGELLSSSAASPPSDPSGAAPGASYLRKKLSKNKTKGKMKGKGSVGGVPPPPPHNDIIIGCVGKRTQYTVLGLVPGRQYRFDLFAVHRRTNLSVAYGSAELHFDARARPTALRDGRASNVSLKSLDGRATFRFKVPRPVMDAAPADLFLYVMACGGGTVDLRVHIQQPPVFSNATSTSASISTNTTPTTQPRAPPAIEVMRTRVEGFASLRLPTPTPGSRLTLRVAAPNAEELRRVSALQVLVTTRPDRFPYPTLPTPARLHEYDSLRRCDSVTVGWLPAAAPPGWSPVAANATLEADEGGSGVARLRYCVSAREARTGDLESGRRADQCALELRVRQATGTKSEAVRVCSEEDTSLVRAPQLPEEVAMRKQAGNAVRASGAVTTQALRNLRPGRVYTVQLTVQRLPTGRPLSYDLLPVRTKPSCT